MPKSPKSGGAKSPKSSAKGTKARAEGASLVEAQKKLSEASSHAESVGVIKAAGMPGAPGWYSCIDSSDGPAPTSEAVAKMIQECSSNGAVYCAAAKVPQLGDH